MVDIVFTENREICNPLCGLPPKSYQRYWTPANKENFMNSLTVLSLDINYQRNRRTVGLTQYTRA